MLSRFLHKKNYIEAIGYFLFSVLSLLLLLIICGSLLEIKFGPQKHAWTVMLLTLKLSI